MAKVYEALRRAEEERKRRTGTIRTPARRSRRRPSSGSRPTCEGSRTPLLASALRPVRRRGSTAPSTARAEVNKRRISLLQPDSYVAEQFRALRGRIDALASQRPIKHPRACRARWPAKGKTTASDQPGDR